MLTNWGLDVCLIIGVEDPCMPAAGLNDDPIAWALVEGLKDDPIAWALVDGLNNDPIAWALVEGLKDDPMAWALVDGLNNDPVACWRLSSRNNSSAPLSLIVVNVGPFRRHAGQLVLLLAQVDKHAWHTTEWQQLVTDGRASWVIS